MFNDDTEIKDSLIKNRFRFKVDNGKDINVKVDKLKHDNLNRIIEVMGKNLKNNNSDQILVEDVKLKNDNNNLQIENKNDKYSIYINKMINEIDKILKKNKKAEGSSAADPPQEKTPEELEKEKAENLYSNSEIASTEYLNITSEKISKNIKIFESIVLEIGEVKFSKRVSIQDLI